MAFGAIQINVHGLVRWDVAYQQQLGPLGCSHIRMHHLLTSFSFLYLQEGKIKHWGLSNESTYGTSRLACRLFVSCSRGSAAHVICMSHWAFSLAELATLATGFLHLCPVILCRCVQDGWDCTEAGHPRANFNPKRFLACECMMEWATALPSVLCLATQVKAPGHQRAFLH